MPEIKNQFTGGKMNKDLDERLVPKGEYRDAMNIQVSTSEESDVGTAQNILGNVPGCTSWAHANNPIPSNAFTVGSIADEKNDSLYWLVSGQEYGNTVSEITSNNSWGASDSVTMKDLILRKNPNGNCEPVFVDIFAFSDPTTLTSNSDVINGVDLSIIQALEVGWTVTGVGNDGTISNTSTITSIGFNSTINIGVTYGYNTVGTSVPQTLFVGNYNPMVQIGTSILIPMDTPPGGGFSQSIQNKIYIKNYSGSNAQTLVGATIVLLPNHPSPQTFTITAVTPITLTQNGANVPDCKELELSAPLATFTNPPVDQPNFSYQVGGLSVDMSSTYNYGQNVIDASITYAFASTQNIATGILEIDPEQLDVSTLSVGSSIWFNGIQYVLGGYNHDPSATPEINEIWLNDANGNIVDGWQVGGNIFGVPQPYGSYVIMEELVEIQLDTALDLSNGKSTHLLFSGPRTLNFDHNKLITGINIVDEMLFWTDNNTEPKKINIPRSVQGSDKHMGILPGNIHTRLINNSQGISMWNDVLVREKHITVIKESPKTPLTLKLNTGRDEDANYSGIVKIDDGNINANSFVSTSSNSGIYDFASVQEGDTIRMQVVSDINNDPDFVLTDWRVGSKIVLKEYNTNTSAPGIPLDDYRIKGIIESWSGNNFDSSNGNVEVSIKITSIAGFPPSADPTDLFRNYAIDLFDESEKLFEYKFPRFSYRYKYQDGEYSTFAPFTNVAFKPGSYEFHPREGYNMALTNRIQSVDLKGFVTQDIPADVKQIDLLYKDDGSSNIYIVDSLKWSDVVSDPLNSWQLNTYRVEQDTIYAAIESNQLLRPWDNVPKKALAQDVTGSRIVYGNYWQNYDIDNLYPELMTQVVNDIDLDRATKSIKSLREYQLGLVFIDKYGRETPVLSNPSGSFKLEKEMANSANQIKARINDSSVTIPNDFSHYKFFIKETSGEYYNLAMDRFYDADDGNVWLAFPSSDVNKMDIDTFLILKKGQDSSSLISESAKYKVIAIENEAPDFIKTSQYDIGTVVQDHSLTTQKDVFGGISNFSPDAPTVGDTQFRIKPGELVSSSLRNVHEIEEDIYIEFGQLAGNQKSNRYRVTNISLEKDPADPDNTASWHYNIAVDVPFDNDINFIFDNSFFPTYIVDQTTLTFYKYVVENKPQFDGRFFVKISRDPTFERIMSTAVPNDDYTIVDERKIYLLPANIEAPHNQASSKVWGDIATSNISNTYDYFDCNCSEQSLDSTSQYTAGTCHEWYYWTAYYTYNQDGGDIASGLPCQGSSYAFRKFNILKTRGVDWHEVWSIDSGFNTAKLKDDGFITYRGVTGHQDNATNDDEVDTGITDHSDHSEISLSFGPIIPGNFTTTLGGVGGTGYNALGQAIPSPIDGQYYYGDFYHPSEEFANLKANGQYGHQLPWIEKLESGTQFIWEQDPTKTVYTVYSSTTETSKVNYEGGYRGAVHYLFHRPENFRKNYHIRCKPSMSGWNPTVGGSDGIITNSAVVNSYITNPGITPIASSNLTASASSTNTVSIPSVQYNNSYDAVNGRFAIVPGMALTHYGSGVPGTTLSTPLVIESIVESGVNMVITFAGYDSAVVNLSTAIQVNDNLTFKQPVMNGLSPNSAKNINEFNTANQTIAAVGYKMQLIKGTNIIDVLPEDPAVWETEPKDSTDLDIYHEISGSNPIYLGPDTIKTALPVGSKVSCINGGGSGDLHILSNYSALGDKIIISEVLCVTSGGCTTGVSHVEVGDRLNITKSDGISFDVTIANIISGNEFELDTKLYASDYKLNWHNCYSFGNGVESNRIRDNFNLPYITNGVKASTIAIDEYKEENRKYGLIYSGLYNSMSGVNNLNQFIQAEKITKDINPTYGSIQKLYAGWGGGGDLITLCEDRVIKILANKDALYNADGNTNITSTNNVLGTATPYAGEYGISKNPESFAVESYRAYFTDKVRGSVMRLSKDGLTPISDAGMKDYFRDNLKNNDKIIGSYDDKKDQYNITLPNTEKKPGFIGTTVTFKEAVRGWVSFKSFVPENAISCANEYYTFKNGDIWKHHVEQLDSNGEETNRNTFYNSAGASNTFTPSWISIVLNDAPSKVKTFHTVNYEGSQSNVNALTQYDTTVPGTNIVTNTVFNNEYYNLQSQPGWYVESVSTNQDQGSLNEFIEKEGKWFNYIKGI